MPPNAQPFQTRPVTSWNAEWGEGGVSSFVFFGLFFLFSLFFSPGSGGRRVGAGFR